MRQFLSALLLLAAFTAAMSAAACGDSPSGGGASVTFITPEGEPTLTTRAEATTTALPELILSTTDIPQGGAILASLVGDVSGGSIDFLGHTYRLAQGDQSMYTFVAAGVDAPVGKATLQVAFTLTNGTTGKLSEEVTVDKTEWTVDSLQFSDETSELANPQVLAADEAKLESYYTHFTPTKLWEGTWQMPIDGPLTARFGEQRSVDGGPVSGHHAGTDIGAEMGTDVRAPNSGQVAFTGQLQAYGNVVVIDHGGGLYSTFGHLSQIDVTQGQTVRTGDVIAQSGNTGLSTGPHLHWEMAVDGVLIDATHLTDGVDGV